jgi:uncharacterized RDD family membrane protein YckC
MTTIPEVPPAAQSVAAAPSIPLVAGFWRRVGAAFVDLTIFGIFGQILGWSLCWYWFGLGPYGRFVGLTVLLLYFGVLNSKWGGGRTLGKRCFGTAVRDRLNNPIGLGRSFLRTLVLILPFILNGWALPQLQSKPVQFIVAVVVFGLGGAIVYTMIFNRRARQGIHDLLCGTYVVRLTGEPTGAFPRTAGFHWAIAGAWCLLVPLATIALSLVGPLLISQADLSRAVAVRDTLQADSRFFSASAFDSRIYPGPQRVLRISVWRKGPLPPASEREEILLQIAQTLLETTPGIDDFGAITITVTSAFDLGISSGHLQFTKGQSLEAWRKQRGANGGREQQVQT